MNKTAIDFLKMLIGLLVFIVYRLSFIALPSEANPELVEG